MEHAHTEEGNVPIPQQDKIYHPQGEVKGQREVLKIRWNLSIRDTLVYYIEVTAKYSLGLEILSLIQIVWRAYRSDSIASDGSSR